MLGDDDSASARGDNPHQEYYKHDGRYQNKDFTRKSDCIEQNTRMFCILQTY